MVWQDLVITGVNIIFIIALIPQVIEGFHKKIGAIRLETSIPTSICLYVLAFAYFTLALLYSALMAIVLAVLWTIIVIQRIKYKPVIRDCP